MESRCPDCGASDRRPSLTCMRCVVRSESLVRLHALAIGSGDLATLRAATKALREAADAVRPAELPPRPVCTHRPVARVRVDARRGLAWLVEGRGR